VYNIFPTRQPWKWYLLTKYIVLKETWGKRGKISYCIGTHTQVYGTIEEVHEYIEEFTELKENTPKRTGTSKLHYTWYEFFVGELIPMGKAIPKYHEEDNT